MTAITEHRSFSIDSYLSKEGADTNYNIIGTLNVGTSGKGANYANRAIMRADVSVIPADWTIDAAKLRWYCSTACTAAGIAATIYRCTRNNWTETGVTWNKYDGTNAWTTAGGDYSTTDSPETKATFNLPTATGWQEITGLANFVAKAIADHSGIMEMIARIDDETASSKIAVYEARTDDTYRPELIIECTTPAGQNWVVVVPAADTYIAEDYATTNYGTDVLVYVAGDAVGGGGDYDAGLSAAATGSIVGWNSQSILAIAQDAVLSRSGALEILARKDNEATTGACAFASKEGTVYADPYVVVKYVVPWAHACMI